MYAGLAQVIIVLTIASFCESFVAYLLQMTRVKMPIAPIIRPNAPPTAPTVIPMGKCDAADAELLVGIPAGQPCRISLPGALPSVTTAREQFSDVTIMPAAEAAQTGEAKHV